MLTYLPSILAMLVIAWVAPADAHDDVVKRCFGGKAVFLQEQINENGTLSEVYDRNGDGKIDIEVVTPHGVPETSPDGSLSYPHGGGVLFVVDQDYDGSPDVVIVDPSGEGVCSKLEVYQNLLHNKREPSSGRTRR